MRDAARVTRRLGLLRTHAVRTLHCVLPHDIDDPLHPTGGNIYDRHVLSGLAAAGWTVSEHLSFDDVPDGALTLVDGLVVVNDPDACLAAARRLALVPLLHLPTLDEAERSVLLASAAVIVTSAWSASQVRKAHGISAVVATPGVDPVPIVAGSADGSRLLCVGTVSPHKGQRDASSGAGSPIT